jgi:hypothetical protein
MKLPLLGWVALLIALIAPFILAVEMVANCWAHGQTRKACDPDGQVPEMVDSTMVAVWAWLANPPQQ